MKRLKFFVPVVMVMAIAATAWGQKPYFIYFQTEDNAPFFVQLNKKNFSSSSIGHLILPGLTNGTYDIKLGYQGQNSMQEYRLVVENKDQGYVVRKSENNVDFSIINLQTEQVQISGSVKRETEESKKQIELAAAEAKRLEEEKAAAEAKRVADEKAAAEAKRLEEEKAAAEAKRMADEKAAADAKKLEEEKVAAAAAGTAVVAEQKTTGEKVVSETGKAEETKKVSENEVRKNTEGEKTSAAGAIVATGAAAAGVIVTSGEKKEDNTKPTTEQIVDSTGSVVNAAKPEPTTVSKPSSATQGAAVAAGSLSAAEIARLQEEARKIDARGKRDSALAAEKVKTSSQQANPVFLELEMTMPDSTKDALVDSIAVPAIVFSEPSKDSVELVAQKAIVDSAAYETEKGDSLKMASAAPINSVADSATAVTKNAADSLAVTNIEKPASEVGVETKTGEAAIAVGGVAIVAKDSTERAVDSTAAKMTTANPICKGDATDAELELISMIVKGEKDPEEAINIIKKTVKVKCVTTAQVRKLTQLFEQDEHRYAMLDIAYRYTSDRENFSSLADLLKDTYYVNRFKAMLQ